MKEFSTYSKEDVIFLLKDISNMIVEEDNLTRERKIQSGTHYSEMIPVEYQVSDEYLTLYREKLKENKEKLAFAIGLFVMQWCFNVFWNPVFFVHHALVLGCVFILLLFLVLVVFHVKFVNKKPIELGLILPYLLWLCVAFSLNLYVFLRN